MWRGRPRPRAIGRSAPAPVDCATTNWNSRRSISVYTLELLFLETIRMPSRTLLATTLGCLLVFGAAFLATPALAQSPGANEMPSVIQVPAEAQPSAHFRRHRRHQRLSGANSCRQDGPLRRLFRGRLLAYPLGFPLWRRNRAAPAEPALVGPYARPRRTRHPLQARTHVCILAAIPRDRPAFSVSRSRSMKTISANTNTDSPPKPSVPGWAINSRVSGWTSCWAACW